MEKHAGVAGLSSDNRTYKSRDLAAESNVSKVVDEDSSERNSEDKPNSLSPRAETLEAREQANKTRFYTVAPKDYTNDTMTKEVDSLLKAQSTMPNNISTYTLPGTTHIVGWGHVGLNASGASTVSVHGRTSFLTSR